MKKFRILLDLDGVLVDFVAGACEVHNIPLEEMRSKWPLGQYLIGEPLGCRNAHEFTEPINKAGENFWYDLKPLPWFRELLGLVNSITDDWHIVSDPGLFVSACGGKARWLKKHFGPHFEQFTLTGHKHFLAQHNRVILVDDKEQNCEQFVEAGGDAIVFPAHGNRYHTFRFDPVAHVQRIFEVLTNEEGQ